MVLPASPSKRVAGRTFLRFSRCPRLLSQSPPKILAAAEYLRSIGVLDVAKVAASFPEVLGPKSLSYPAAVECLKGWSFSAADIVCIIRSGLRF